MSITPTTADVEFFFDPICPFCWQTSRFVRQVQHLRGLDVRWRFISLRFLNEPLGYEDRPAFYPEAHREGTRMLRIAAETRERFGDGAVGRLYDQMGAAVWEIDPPGEGSFPDILEHHAAGFDHAAMLAAAELPRELAAFADRDDHDEVLKAETAAALERAGDDVGTPIITFGPPDGPSFFGPVISELPSDDDALELWDAIERVANWPGFSELKRSLRTFPDLGALQALRGQGTDVS